MSILIKDMEIPENGSCIQIVIDDDGKVYSTVEECIMKIGSIATAVPISLHGRLIDADTLYEDCALDNRYEVAATTTRINEYIQLKIDAAPTIIPAEQKGE